MNVRAGFLESRAVVLCTRSVLDPNVLILGSGKVSYSSSSYLKYTEYQLVACERSRPLVLYRHCSYPVDVIIFVGLGKAKHFSFRMHYKFPGYIYLEH